MLSLLAPAPLRCAFRAADHGAHAGKAVIRAEGPHSTRSGKLTYNPPPTIPNTQLALRVTELTRSSGTAHRPTVRRARRLCRRAAPLRGGKRSEAERAEQRPHASTQQAHQLGINGIPAFLLDGKLLVLGAQPLEVFEQALGRLES